MKSEIMKKSEIDRHDLIVALQNSLYVGAKPESINMVITYCVKAGLDVMQKPVHIVPMNIKNSATGCYEWRDVVMPGIGLYRIQADRSGTLAGISEPEFGENITGIFTCKSGNSVEVSYPEWCRISMKKIVGSHIVEFVSKEYWLENYATDSRNSSAPNSMWKKRPRGQLAKCAEAQALRKGWPEVGQSPTAEEMEGKDHDAFGSERVTAKTGRGEKIILQEYPDKIYKKNKSVYAGLILSGKPAENIINKIESKYTMTIEQKKELLEIENSGVK